MPFKLEAEWAGMTWNKLINGAPSNWEHYHHTSDQNSVSQSCEKQESFNMLCSPGIGCVSQTLTCSASLK